MISIVYMADYYFKLSIDSSSTVFAVHVYVLSINMY